MNRGHNPNFSLACAAALAAFAGFTATWPISTAAHLGLVAVIAVAALVGALLGK